MKDALQDLDLRKFTAVDLDNPSRQGRRLLDQFAYRYTRRQDIDSGTTHAGTRTRIRIQQNY